MSLTTTTKTNTHAGQTITVPAGPGETQSYSLTSGDERLTTLETAICAAVWRYGPVPVQGDILLLGNTFLALKDAVHAFSHSHRGLDMADIFKAIAGLSVPVLSLAASEQMMSQFIATGNTGNTTLATPIGAGPVVAPVVAPLPLATI